MRCFITLKPLVFYFVDCRLFLESKPWYKWGKAVISFCIPAATHNISRLLKVCYLIAGETDFSSSGDPFAGFHILCHGSTFTWQQRVTKTAEKQTLGSKNNVGMKTFYIWGHKASAGLFFFFNKTTTSRDATDFRDGMNPCKRSSFI